MLFALLNEPSEVHKIKFQKLQAHFLQNIRLAWNIERVHTNSSCLKGLCLLQSLSSFFSASWLIVSSIQQAAFVLVTDGPRSRLHTVFLRGDLVNI